MHVFVPFAGPGTGKYVALGTGIRVVHAKGKYLFVGLPAPSALRQRRPGNRDNRNPPPARQPARAGHPANQPHRRNGQCSRPGWWQRKGLLQAQVRYRLVVGYSGLPAAGVLTPNTDVPPDDEGRYDHRGQYPGNPRRVSFHVDYQNCGDGGDGSGQHVGEGAGQCAARRLPDANDGRGHQPHPGRRQWLRTGSS